MQTRLRVGYIDLLETQIKTEMNTAEMEGEYWGDGVRSLPRAVYCGALVPAFWPLSPLPMGIKGTGGLSQRRQHS